MMVHSLTLKRVYLQAERYSNVTHENLNPVNPELQASCCRLHLSEGS